jgi:chorismate mutase/prephenate dehydrogenase
MTSANSDEPLAALRAELDRIDQEILERVAARLAIVGRVRAAKAASGRQVFDRAREQEVMRSAEDRARELGVSPTVARELMTVLIEASHELQQRPAAVAKRVLIIGGAGRMGKRFAEAFAARGHDVDVIERGEGIDHARIARADVVMIAVPMTVAESVTAEVAPLIRADALLCDINSLKQGVCAAMAACPGEAIGMHPMFGPTVASLRRQKIVVCPVKRGSQAAWLEGELADMGAELVDAEPEEHDRMMAAVQVLTHFGILTMGMALARSGHALERTLAFMSPIYRLEVSMVGRLFSQSPDLYREIVMRNPFGAELRARFVEEARDLERIIGEADGAAFLQRFAETRAYFASFSAEAMALSDQIIDTVMSRA